MVKIKIQDFNDQTVDKVVGTFVKLFKDVPDDQQANVSDIVLNPSRAIYFCDEFRKAVNDTECSIYDITIITTLWQEYNKGRIALQD